MYKYPLSLILLIATGYLSLCSRSDAMETSFDIPFYINGSLQGETPFNFEQETIDLRPIVTRLNRLLNETGRDLIKRDLHKPTFASPPVDLDQRITIDFVSSIQVVQVRVDPKLLAIVETDLSDRDKATIKPIRLMNPASFSSYINLNAAQYFRKNYYSDRFNQSRFFGSTNFCFNLNEWIVEGFLYLIDHKRGLPGRSNHRLNRGNIFLTKDWLQRDLRFTLGDISPRSIGFQNSAPLFGFQATRNPLFFGKSAPNIGPVGQQTFFLNAPSKVDVYVNQVLIKTVELAAGPHLVKNFPMSGGLNRIDLVISDPMGNTTTLNLNQYFSQKLLRPGHYTYSVSTGFPRFQEISQKYLYLFKHPVLSACFAKGINEHFTEKFYLQATKDSIFSGGILAHENRLFYVESDIGLSYSPFRSGAAGVRSRLSLQKTPTTKAPAYRLSVEFIGRHFSNFLGKKTVNPQKVYFSGSVGAPIGNDFNTNIQAYYGVARNSFANNWNLGWSLSGRLRKNLSLSLLTLYKKMSNGSKVFESIFSLRFAPSTDTKFSSNYNSRTRITNTYGSYRKNLSRNRSLDATIGHTHAKYKNQLTGSLNYRGDRGSFYVDHYLYENSLPSLSSRSTISSVTTIKGSTALVYADKTFALSRSISNNFAIVKPVKFSNDSRIKVYTKEFSEPISQSAKMLPAVIPNLPSYSNTPILIQAGHIGSDYDLAQNTYTLGAKYKSGFKINVEVQDKVCHAEGFLKDRNHQPLEYKNIVVFNKLGMEEKIDAFTNSNGKFYLMNIPPGTYTLKIVGVDHSTIQVEIPDRSKPEVVYLGEIKVDVIEKNRALTVPSM
ncbi:MAG: hypothetical protein AAGE99_00180 [Chlamydiota bacterium]